MLKSRYFLMAILILCIGFILFALYLQFFWVMLPCPLCVLQRYAFIAIGVCCAAGLVMKRYRISAVLGGLFSVTGAGLALYQLWVIAHPAIQCGRDPLEVAVNRLWPAHWLPALFQAEGLCGDVLEPIFWLTPPQWALFWFCLFALVFARIVRKG